MNRIPKADSGKGPVLWNYGIAVLAASMVFAQAATHRNCPLPDEERIASLMGWNPIWSMYTNLPKYEYYFSTEATLLDGTTVDLINSDLSTHDRQRVQQFHRSYRIRFFLQSASGVCDGFHTRYLTHLVDLWNQNHSRDQIVVRAKILGMSRQIRTSSPEKTEVILDVGFSQLPTGDG